MARSIILKYAYLLGFKLEIVLHEDGWIFHDAVAATIPRIRQLYGPWSKPQRSWPH